VKIEIDVEVSDKIVLSALKQAHQSMVKDQTDTLAVSLERDLMDYEKEDLADNMVLCTTFLRVIQYYSTPDEFEAYVASVGQ
jgi:hypothetical protein